MSTITQVPFYPSDWLAGTRGMTAAQMGVYITIIAMMYERAGPVRCDDMAKLARLCGTSASGLKTLLEDLISDGKLVREGDMLSNRRAMLEIKNVMSKSEVAREKANARWAKNYDKSMVDECSGISPAMLAISHKPLDISFDAPAPKKAPEKPKPEPSRFDEFLAVYPKRDGSNPKEPARQKFDQAVKRGEDPEVIISAAKRYAEQQKRLGNIGTPYVKQAVSWLNAKSWLDDYGSPSNAVSDDLTAKQRAMLEAMTQAHLESIVSRYFARQWQWNSAQMGPPPDRPNTLIPPEIIAKCRPKEGQAA